MSLTQQLEQELQALVGFQGATPHVTRLADPGGLELEVSFLQVDAVGCSVEEIQLFVTTFQTLSMQQLEDWAKELCSRITYLLEHIGTLEIDDQNQQALIRSTPPAQLPTGTKYYEIILKSKSGGRFSLKRFSAVKGHPGRTPVPMQLTHEVLLKLVDDLVDSIP